MHNPEHNQALASRSAIATDSADQTGNRVSGTGADDTIRLLYLTAEQWPTFRQDLVALFGKYLPRFGIQADLVTEQEAATAELPPWGGGAVMLCKVPRQRAAQYLLKLGHNLKTLWSCNPARYQAIQVRDMTVSAWFGLMTARRHGLRFYYWLSFPQSEGQIARAQARGPGSGLRFWFPLLQGWFGKWLLYRIVLPAADHIFVQSVQMKQDLLARGIPAARMSPVPMGIDLENLPATSAGAMPDPRLQNRPVLVYLGTLDPARQIDILLEMLAIARKQKPDLLLVLVGDTEDAGHRQWLRDESRRLELEEQVIFTGWLPISDAWQYVRSASIGLSPFPRGPLLDSASPTKAVEYLALGLPVIVNDNPDQKRMIEESQAGLCVPLTAQAFADAALQLLNNPSLRQTMAQRGREYAHQHRSYAHIASELASIYHALQRH